MTYRGRVHHGVVEFEGAAPEEGTLVEVAALTPTPAEAPPGSPAAILRHAGTWRGESNELEQLLSELRSDKWAEVESERADLDDD